MSEPCHKHPGLAQISGFYPTPPTVISMMMELAGVWARKDRALEPSAGRGDIADRMREVVDDLVVVEPNPTLAGVLMSKGYQPQVCRFEDYQAPRPFDKIVMNPPFSQGLDMQHVRHAFEMLAQGGVLVALMNDGDAPGDGTSSQREAFASWLVLDRAIDSVRIERLAPHLLLSAENFRPSTVPVKLVRLRKGSNPEPR